MEKPEPNGQHNIKGGKTILGKVFAYQEKTGMSIKEIMRLPYIFFVIGMYDAPSIDYGKVKGKENEEKPNNVNDQLNALSNFLG